MAGMHYDRFMLDKEGHVLSSGDLNVQKMYETLHFSEQVLKRYGLDSERIQNKKDLDGRLDRAITGLETELALKSQRCKDIVADIKATEDKLKRARAQVVQV